MRSALPGIAPTVFVLALGLSACRAGPSDVRAWQRTVRGPDKLAALAGSHRYDVPLRAEALVALGTMDAREPTQHAEPFEPTRALEAALDRLAEARDPQFPAVLDAATTRIVAMLAAPAAAVTPASAQSLARVKDAAVALAEHATGPTRTRLVDAVMAYFAQDFARRSTQGEYDVDECAHLFGSSAVATLLPAATARLDKDALPRLAKVFADHGDAALRTRAAARFLEVEAEMSGDAFRTWVDTEVRKALSSAGPLPSEARMSATVTLTRETFLTQGAIGALKALAKEPAVRTRLLAIASTKSFAGVDAERAKLRRVEALSALGGAVGEAEADALLALALDATNDGAVRELALDRLAETRALRVLPQLHPFVAAAGDVPGAEGDTARQMRARMAELELALGAPPAEVLGRLPSGPTVAYTPAELEGYGNRIGASNPPPLPLLRDELRASFWVRRVVAIHGLAKAGDASDVARLEALVADATPTVGPSFASRQPPLTTVGQVAAQALTSLRERLAQPPATP